jgi:EmrB/QacA subfamily drug resistance transporter
MTTTTTPPPATGPNPAVDGSSTSRAVPTGVAAQPTDTLSPLGLTVLLAGALLSITDFFIVNVALPDIHRSFGTSAATLELVITGYGVGYALLLVVGGRLGDRLGRKRLFMGGMAAFTMMSLVCGVTPTAGTLIAARVAQGVAAAMMVPQVMATIQATTTGERRAKALGWFGATAGIAAVVGQVWGGLLVSADIAGSGWRPIFLVNVPVGAVALVAARRLLPDTRSPAPARADVLGTVLLAVTVICMLLPLMEGRSVHWPTWSLVMLMCSPVALVAFVLAERRVERNGSVPLIPPSLVRMPSMARGLALMVPFFAGFGAFMFVYSVAVQQGLGHSPLVSGLTIAPMAVAFLLASVSTSRLLTRYGRNLLTAGALVQATGLVATAELLMRSWPNVPLVELGALLAVVGSGQGLVLSPLFGVVLSRVPVNEAGIGSGVLVTTQQISLALGVATLGNVFLSLGTGHGISMGVAFAIIVLVQAGIGVAFAALAQTLPTARRS